MSLFDEVTDLTGLPKDLISQELVAMLDSVGANPQEMTLEDLRKAMAAYLMEVMGPPEQLEQPEKLDPKAD